MTSLKFIDKYIKIINNQISFLHQIILHSNDKNYIKIYKNQIKELEEERYNFYEIKKNLEVLKIIKNKKIDIQNLINLFIYNNACIKKTLKAYNDFYIHNTLTITMIELLKIIDWLELNKVGDTND